MMAASQQFATAMIWSDKLVWLHIWPPTTMQVRDYIAATSSHPSGALAPAQGEEVETQPSPNEPHPNAEPQSDLTQDIWELWLDQLWEVLRALHMEIVRGRGCTPTGVALGQSEGPWGWQHGQSG